MKPTGPMHSPWQRDSNENTNGLLRQCFPTGTSVAKYGQVDLDLVAVSLNDRFRKTRGCATPAERFRDLLAKVASLKQPLSGGVRFQT